MIQDQPHHQGGQCRLRLFRQSRPHRYAACRWRVPCCEQVDLLRHTSVCRPPSVLAWHGPLPDSGHRKEVIRLKRLRPMLQRLCSEHPAKGPPASPTRPGWCGAPHPDRHRRRSTGQTSTLESPATAPTRTPLDRSGKQRRPAAQSPRECQLEDPTMDARDTAPREARYCGRFYVLLYNGRRPHSSLDGTTPDQAYFTPLPLRLAA